MLRVSKIVLAVASAALLVTLATTAVVANSDNTYGKIQGQGQQINQLQQKVDQLSRQVLDDEQQIRQMSTTLAAATGQLKSASPFGDLITCQDLQNLGLQNTYGVLVDSTGNVNLQQSPITVPPHCFKSAVQPTSSGG